MPEASPRLPVDDGERLQLGYLGDLSRPADPVHIQLPCLDHPVQPPVQLLQEPHCR
ncbi:hypothetical protein JG688_00004923 [Phytophthora aleatoria]|uniref:Uncharacterized protein n=1 Tax=Phytophthora aleatoria TaxID=2496075 RepID=A0A8J5M6X8_9STRA|nr:hypothetical protein JG688_00004923 [Phytophthora aleatoria]